MDAHTKLEYHMTAMTKMSEFVARFEHPSEAIDTQLNKETKERMEENQKVIESLLKIVMLCGKQGIALRGHRHDHIVWTDEDFEAENEGNFIELIRFRAETDDILRRHLDNAPRNARYTSKTVQNELISIIGNRIRTDILSEVKQAKFFSVIADEVVDIANKEQLSVCLRYVFDNCVTDFVPIERITGEVIADAIICRLKAWGLSLADLRGQCYDGSSNMAGARSGCKSIVQQQAPMAIYSHCAAHQLNLAVVSACKIQAFQNTESCIGEMTRFFKFSAKRQRLLDRALDIVTPVTHAKKLKDACRTRWIQRIDSYTVFLELLPAVHTALEAISCPSQFKELGTDWSWDGETLTKANGFLYQLESSSFLVCFKILLEVLSYLRSLTLKLQMEALDVIYAYRQVDSVISALRSMREGSDREFKRIFAEITTLGKQLHGEKFELEQPRVNKRQMHRSNIPATTAEEYYRVSLYNEFLSHVTVELQERFCDTQVQGIGLMQLLPTQCCSFDIEDTLPQNLAQAVAFYELDLPHPTMVPIEYRMWVRKWKQHTSDFPKKLIDVLQACDPVTFPNVRVLLQLALTLPITSCESERSFSQLKLIKTSRRSTIAADRLSGLSLMKINRIHCEKLQQSHMKELVQSFNQLHPRRMKLPFLFFQTRNK